MNEIRSITKTLKVVLITFAFINCSLYSYAFNKNKIFVATTASNSTPIGKYLYLLVDKESRFNESNITNDDTAFKLQKKDIPKMDVKDGTSWLNFSVLNATQHQDLFLDIQYSNISEISLYRKIDNKLVLIQRAGNSIKPELQAQKRAFAFRLRLPPSDTGIYYLKIKSYHPLFLPMFIKDTTSLDESINSGNLIFGLYFGIILSLLLYNIFLLISTKDLSYLFYVIYLFFLGFAQVTVSGYGYTYFWPSHPDVNRYMLLLTSCTAGITGILFAIFFLRIAYYYKTFVFLFSIVIFLFFVAIIATISGNNQLGYKVIDYAQLAGGVLLILISFLIGRKGYKPAYFYLIAWTAFLAGVIVISLRNIGIVPYTTFSTYVLYLGSAIEAIFLSTALADRINSLRKEKQESQVYALKISRENETLIKEQNVVLEQKVTERTNELVSTNMQLNHTLAELKDAQTQLVEAEKMASLGQLTAGIAHEINNPINFVKSNIKPLNLDIDDVFEVVAMYRKLHNANKEIIPSLLQEVDRKQEEIDMEFVKKEIRQLIKGIEEGAERTAEIVRGLRTFSRLDEGELKVANVHEGLNSTLVLLRNSMPGYLRVEKQFNAKGDIECFPGKLNQVFMNIINNAIQAIDEKQVKQEQEWILISTVDVPGNKMQVRIKDSGIGMNEQVKHKIFEPFFTTKSVGVGTGLGMAIVFKIIEEHHGKIEVESEPGKGAEFILTLPYIHPVT
ncbi:sensor histidine kinase [Panacibacter ginsenosidivorans]|nr:7TM diverse intracellular signaling domain-containing protein [Panacibacter ginsenosidivorans]